MLRSVPMELFNVVILDDDLESVTELIVRHGVLHLVKINELEQWAQKLESVGNSKKQNIYLDFDRRIKSIFRKLGETKNMEKEISEYKMPVSTEDDIFKALTEVENEVNQKIVEKESLAEKLKIKSEIYKQVDILGPMGIGQTARGKYSFLEVVVGKISSKNMVFLKNGLSDIPNVVMPFRTMDKETMVLVIILKRDAAVLGKLFNEVGFERISVPEEAGRISEDVKREIRKEIETIEGKISSINGQISQYRKKVEPMLLDFLSQGMTKTVIMSAEGYFHKTNRTYLISGWLPLSERQALIKSIEKLIGGRCYIYEERPESIEAVKVKKEKVPVLFSNPKFIKPFEMLISSYGLPDYKAIDPTIFVAISFLVMFGAMFGDVGHGLALLLAGLLLSRNKKEFVSKAGVLVAYCGASSILFGFLYGSIFGIEGIIHSFWMKPINNISSFLKLSVFFGIFMISLGIVLNIVNAFRTKDIIKGIFDKAGLIGGLIYWAGLGVAAKSLEVKAEPLAPGFVLGLIGVPVFLLFLKAPVEKIITKRDKIFQEGFITYLIETLVEVVEIFIGYLANTISYIRIAAFSLAHVGLFLAVFSLADMVRSYAGGSLWSFLLIVLGNVFILVLEGMVVTIQSIRLEYYEFFSKFFEGEGKEYKPIKLG